MEKLGQYRVPLIVAVGTLIVIAVVFVAWISPEDSKLSSLHAQQSKLQTQQVSLQAEIQMLQHEQEDVGPTCSLLTQELAEVPGTPTVDSFLRQVSALAVASGDPNTPSISVMQATGTGTGSGGVTGATSVTVSLTLAGTYGQMSAFLQGLYSSSTVARLYTISDITINGVVASGGGSVPSSTNPNYSLSLTGSIFYSGLQPCPPSK